MNRRTFLAAASASAVFGANERIGVGIIGCGRRGLLKEVLQFFRETNVEVVAVCDTWRQQREESVAAVRAAGGAAPEAYVHYQDLLANRKVDAVVISTPDHQHCTQLVAAARAGKDAYVEKPLAMDMKELVLAVDTVKKHSRVVQCGTQIRSLPASVAARAFVAAGKLGQMLKVEQVRNSYRPYWHSYAKKVEAADVDWRAFLMHRKYRPFDADQYSAWYGYRDFSRGPHTNLMVHFIDLVHYITGAKLPRRAVTLGGIFRWKDQRNVPDSVETVLEYPEGFMARYSTVFGTAAGNYLKFFGARGTIDASRWNWKEPFPLSGEGSGEPDRIKKGETIPEMESTPHMKNWLECLHTRKEPNAPIDAGYAHSVAVILADEALMQGKRMVYDAARRVVRAG